jgi:hypothetical protein
MSNSQANQQDAELILKLYDLRREPVMREARNFVATFSPASIDDVLAVVSNFGVKENAYLRQVYGYWEMVAALIVHGTLNAALAYDTLQEMYFVYSIMQPYVEEFRQKANAPEFLKNVQKVVESSPEGKERITVIRKRMAEFARMRAATAKQGA